MPFECKADVDDALPVVCDYVEVLKSGYEMLSVDTVDVFDAKVVDYEREFHRVGSMSPQAFYETVGLVSVSYKVIYEALLG